MNTFAAKTVAILGTSENPLRPSFSAQKLLQSRGFSIFALDKNETPNEPINTISIFLNAVKQKKYYTTILTMKPKRIVFNPGAENLELEEFAKQHKIQVIKNCTIAMLVNGWW